MKRVVRFLLTCGAVIYGTIGLGILLIAAFPLIVAFMCFVLRDEV